MSDDTTTQMMTAMQAINDNATRLIAKVGDDQWNSATPCTEWTVQDLVLHMTNTTQFFAACAGRTEPSPPFEATAGIDQADRFSGVAEATIAAWKNSRCRRR